MKKYKCINDYHPLLRDKATKHYWGKDPVILEEVRQHNASIKLVPTKDPIVVKGDVMVKMGKDDSRFLSSLNPECALYEYTLQAYPDCFELV